MVSRVEAQGNISMTETAAVVTAAPKLRLYFLDNLKILLAVLVVLHHAGQPYGPGGDWWVASEPEQFITMLVLGIFFSVNSAFFMGLFFLISAYFVPVSVDRKGPAKFTADRLARLGTPILIFSLAVFPVMSYLLFNSNRPFIGYYLDYVNILNPGNGLSLGHLWFLGLLLVFSAGYLVLRLASKRPGLLKRQFPGNGSILTFAAVMAIVTFAIRIVSPVNDWFPLFHLFEPAHITQYVLLFAAGIVAYRNGWLEDIPAAVAKFWWRVAGLMVLAIPVIYAVFGDATDGGLSFGSLVDSIREALLCVGLCIGLLSLFRNRYNWQNKLTKVLADNAFTVYLIHIPVVVFLQYLLVGVEIHPLLKFAIVAAVGVPLTFAISHFVIRKLPYVKNIL
jgi:peptidoglycan/LPS O-acetylase OafA/YrhL